MSTLENLNNSKLPIIVIDNTLEQFRDKDIFPKKMAKAKEILKNVGLPNFKNLAKS